MSVKLTYLGHAAFLLQKGDVALILDPFLRDNPWQIAQPEDIKCQYIFVSHGHGDHYGDTDEIAKANDALLISTAEIANRGSERNLRTHAMHIGGAHDFEFGSIRITPAFHGAGIEGGHAAGALINFYGKTIYFAGDTGLFYDMEHLSRFGEIDYALLPIGDNFTMGIEDAAIAASLINARITIPMHYKTWPVIDKDPHEFTTLIGEKYRLAGLVVNPGETITFE